MCHCWWIMSPQRHLSPDNFIFNFSWFKILDQLWRIRTYKIIFKILSKLLIVVPSNLAREFRLYMDFDILKGALSDWELSCVVMQFDLICVHFLHMTEWIFSNVKMNSESIGGVIFPDTCTHLLLNEQFLTLSAKMYLNEY